MSTCDSETGKLDPADQYSVETLRMRKAFDYALTYVKACANSSADFSADSTLILAGELLFNGVRVHAPSREICWPDRFVVATVCGLEWHRRQRVAAWALVSLALDGQWQWTTMQGFNLLAMLQKLKLVGQDFVPPQRAPGVPHDQGPTKGILAGISAHFELPTNYFIKKQILSGALAEARRFCACTGQDTLFTPQMNGASW